MNGSAMLLWRRRFVCLVLSALVSAGSGCIGISRGEMSGGPPQSSEGDEVSTFEMDLRDLPPGADWILVEVSAGEALLSLEWNLQLPADAAMDACATVHAGPRGSTIFQLGATPVVIASSIGGRRPVIQQGGLGTFGYQWVDSFQDARAGSPLPILFGIASAERWRSAGAQVSLQLKADGPLEIGSIEAVSGMCMTRLNDFEGGTFVETPALSFGENLQSNLVLERSGCGYVFPYGNLGYEFRILNGTGAVWRSSATPGGESEGAFLCALEPGMHILSVPYIRGVDASVAVFLADLPAWATAVMSDPTRLQYAAWPPPQ